MLESNFQRQWTLNLSNPEFKSEINIDIDDTRTNDSVSVTVSLNYTAGAMKTPEISAVIKMVGVFIIGENGDLSIDNFAKINAPAIIFPFLREHLASLSIKAGINPILLPPVNFVKHQHQKNKEITQ